MLARHSVAIIGTRGYPSYYGGFETAVRKLAPYLADRGWDVTVYGREKQAGSVPDTDARVTSIVTRGIETKSLSTLSHGLTSSLDVCRRRPDAALVMNVANGFWLPMLRGAGIPTVVNVDGIEWEREKWGWLAKAMFKAGARMTARFGYTLVYDSLEIARRWMRDFHRDGAFIPYGGDRVGELPLVEGLTHRGYVLLVARFVPENTIGEFFAAAEKLTKRWPVVIVGSTGFGGALDEAATRLADAAPRITWLGHVRDDAKLYSLWQHCGAYFHGHSVGGTNPALVQAMACGAPVVARNTPYNLEVLGEGGTYTEPTSESIESAIQAMMTDPAKAERASANALERSAEAYTWAGVCAAYEETLVAAIESNAAR